MIPILQNFRSRRIIFLTVLTTLILVALFLIYNRNQALQKVKVPANGIIEVKSESQNGIILGNSCGKYFVEKKAKFIIDGFITKINESWNTERTSNKIVAEFSVDKFRRGPRLNVSKIIISDTIDFDKPMKEGELNPFSSSLRWDYRQNRPVFHEGQKTRLFLNEYNGDLNIICGNYGIEEI